MASPSLTSKHTITTAAVLALLVLGACGPGGGSGSSGAAGGGSTAAPDLTAAIAVEDASVGRGAVVVTVTEGGEAVSGAAVTVQGDMTHAGMVPVISEAEEGEPGVYRTTGFAFTMAGDWIVTAEVETADGRSVEAETFLTVAR